MKLIIKQLKNMNKRNDEFIQKHKISVVMSKEKKHARTALFNHLKNMNT